MWTLNILQFVNCVFVVQVLVSPLTLSSAARQRTRTHRSDGNDVTSLARRHGSSSNFNNDHDADDFEDLDPDDILNLRTGNEVSDPSQRSQIDPKSSWLTFSNRLDKHKSDRKKKKRKRKGNNALLGPQGPAGPPGPPGPPGQGVSREEILREVEALIKEAAEKRATLMLSEMHEVYCNSSHALPQQDMTSTVMATPRVYAGFSMRLKNNAKARRKTFMELKSFQQPFGDGSFQRGDLFNAKEGRFYVPKEGIYQFTATLHLRMRTKRKVKGRLKSDEHIRVIICIDSLCLTNTSIESIAGVHFNNTYFSTTLHGLLHLKEKQYTSVYIDNSSAFTIVIQQGSEFSGLLMGE
ncbi:adipolin-like [Mya arenaria]|uniref:adipolin-like n=1 Tax=Mya arenaria TaxID=6604 RepID=UPI0022E66160|nr:adipolin-like [Mya arenaria]